MERQAIESEAIRSWRYYAVLRLFEVEFITGSIYHYFDVPQEIYEEGQRAESKGTWFNTIFKSKGYRYKEFYRPPHLPPRKPGQADYWLH